MPPHHRLKINSIIIGKKILSTKSIYFLFLLLIVLIVYVWVKDSYSTSFQFYLFLFPYIFLFISQDMMKEEIESGFLENITFVEGGFKHYLFQKNIILFLMALSVSLATFLILTGYGLISGNFFSVFLLQFLIGSAAGAYYISLSGWLSFYFKGGSNVLIIIIGQLVAFIGLVFSVTNRAGFLDNLINASFPTWDAKLKFIAFMGILPNILVSKKYFSSFYLIVVLSCLFFTLQWLKIKNLELKKQ